MGLGFQLFFLPLMLPLMGFFCIIRGAILIKRA
jgi:hypothetical protein